MLPSMTGESILSLNERKITNSSVRNAFTQAAPRRAFAAPSQTETPRLQSQSVSSVSTAEKTKVDWPDTVRSYVQRAFAVENASPEVSREEMEIKLKQIIAQSVQNNSLRTIDWATALLPQQVILQDRKAPSIRAANIPWKNSVAPLMMNATNDKAPESLPRKRKSGEMGPSEIQMEKVPPWQMGTQHKVLEDRITYPDKRQRIDDKPKSMSKSQKRKQRFELGQTAPLHQKQEDSRRSPDPSTILNQGPVVGRCENLEKKYFRLTAPPNPETVRPLHVLEKTLDFLKKKWRTEQNYSYICDQLKSLRQDLTVQHIKTHFTVNVYELHARIALEKGDLGEYNQCQTQLRALYSQQLGGHPEEFKAYRILYFIHTCNRSDMNDVLADLTAAEKKHFAIKHALDTRSALALGNYHRFFQLYLETPNMGAYLLDMFVGRQRLVALSNICVS